MARKLTLSGLNRWILIKKRGNGCRIILMPEIKIPEAIVLRWWSISGILIACPQKPSRASYCRVKLWRRRSRKARPEQFPEKRCWSRRGKGRKERDGKRWLAGFWPEL